MSQNSNDPSGTLLPDGYTVVATLQMKVRFTEVAAVSRLEAAKDIERRLRAAGLSPCIGIDQIDVVEAVVSDCRRTGQPTIEIDGTVSYVETTANDPLSGRNALFIGQAWINNNCFNVDDGRCVIPLTRSELKDALRADPVDLDFLADARHAPPKVRTWPGPFKIVLNEDDDTYR